MLARLSQATSRFPVQFERPTRLLSGENDIDVLATIDLDALRVLLAPIPDIAWWRVLNMCGRTCKSIHNILNDDVEHLARLMSDLDPISSEDLTDDCSEKLPAPLDASCLGDAVDLDQALLPESASAFVTSWRRRSKPRCRTLDHPLFIPSTHPSAPSILITPCETQPRETSCWVPYQDSAFDRRLTVPNYPVHNSAYPPQRVARPPLRTESNRWRYEQGHWRVILPTVEEQTKKGFFSRPVAVKRRFVRNASSAHA